MAFWNNWFNRGNNSSQQGGGGVEGGSEMGGGGMPTPVQQPETTHATLTESSMAQSTNPEATPPSPWLEGANAENTAGKTGADFPPVAPTQPEPLQQPTLAQDVYAQKETAGVSLGETDNYNKVN